MTGLELRCGLSRGTFTLDAEFEAPAGCVTALFGPSGAGKTTLLRCIAGLERPRSGRLVVDGECWYDEARGVFVPPHRRRVGYAFQEARLFPHLSVRGNLNYGATRVRPGTQRVALDEVVEWLGLADLLERDPAGLSGGERRRVGVARALMAGPRVLLLDEPLAALDEPGRRAILPYLESLCRRLAVPVIYVSHSVAEVVRLADRIVWLGAGRVRAVGPPAEILTRTDLAREQDDDAAALIQAQVEGHDEADHLTRLRGAGSTLRLPRIERRVGDRVRLRIAARDVSLGLDRDERSSILNEIPARVLDMSDSGPGQVLLRLTCGDAADPVVLLARITQRSRRRLGLEPGTSVFARVKGVSLVD